MLMPTTVIKFTLLPRLKEYQYICANNKEDLKYIENIESKLLTPGIKDSIFLNVNRKFQEFSPPCHYHVGIK